MGRVARALVFNELLDRTRDRWVLMVSILFALLASAVSLYGRSAEAPGLTGPSLVTLTTLLVPLVALVLSHDAIVGERERNTLGLLLSMPVSRAEVIVAKFLGRGLALALAVGLGIGVASLAAGPGEGRVLLSLVAPTLLLGLSFLSLGVLISAVSRRQITAASLVVVAWFALVFFYDLGLLALLVTTDGQVGQGVITDLVLANPAGLFRLQMMTAFSGPAWLEGLGITAGLPAPWVVGALWAAWIVGPLLASGLVIGRQRSIS